MSGAPDNAACGNAAPDNAACGNAAPDNGSSDNGSSDNSGSDNSGSDNSGSDNSGSDNSGSGPAVLTDAGGRRGASVTIEHLVKRYRTGDNTITAVDDVSIDIEPGTLVAITGVSGSGKSTLLHLVGAMDQADEGSITVDDTDITALRRRQLTRYRRGIGFVFQRYHLLPALNALDNVLAPVLPYRVDFDRDARARELLAAVGLAGRERALPSQLSGGQQQRVAIARALINHPTLLLADEPTGNLDSSTGTEILDLLVDLQTDHAMTILVATHEHHVAARCQRLIRLRDGQITDDHDLTAGHPTSDTLVRVDGLRI